MEWSINDSDFKVLFAAVASALDDALKDSTSTREPQVVANLVWHIPRKINAFSSKSDFSVKSGGVFVHSRPLVTCNNFPQRSPGSVEIGDLLLLRTGMRGGTAIDRRAMLFQVKKYDTLPVTPGNENQHHLYAHWPRFEYTHSTAALNGQTRHVSGLDIYNAAKYLLIGKKYQGCMCYPIPPFNCFDINQHLHRTNALTAQPSKPELGHYQCFLVELIDFILSDAGRPYKTPPHWRDKNWNRVIDDLTKVTASQATNYMQRATSRASNTRGQFLFFMTGSLPKESTFFTSGGLLSRETNGVT